MPRTESASESVRLIGNGDWWFPSRDCMVGAGKAGFQGASCLFSTKCMECDYFTKAAICL
jgi:hypothetical protein